LRSVIVSHPDFDGIWPFAADHFHELWMREGPVEFIRLGPDDRRPVGEILSAPGTVTRLIGLGLPLTTACAGKLVQLEEAAFSQGYSDRFTDAVELLRKAGVRIYEHTSEGFWGESVAEFGLALTLCALRRIPQTYCQMLTGHEVWDYSPPGGIGQPGARGHQFGDESRFTSGTVEGKRVRMVGLGNIGSRYAGFARALGADVSAWDPVACEPAFHRTGARRVWRIEDLLDDAEIFAPMMPLVEKTRGVVTAAHIERLPKGCLVVLVTRAGICDMEAIRRRVLADEISLAADVFDVEPLPLDDPLLGRRNVVHTPHNAGRTRDANMRWAEALASQFKRGN